MREIQHLELRGELKLSKLNNVDKKALGWYEECKERSERRAERHREREKQAERKAHNETVTARCVLKATTSLVGKKT